MGQGVSSVYIKNALTEYLYKATLGIHGRFDSVINIFYEKKIEKPGDGEREKIIRTLKINYPGLRFPIESNEKSNGKPKVIEPSLIFRKGGIRAVSFEWNSKDGYVSPKFGKGKKVYDKDMDAGTLECLMKIEEDEVKDCISEIIVGFKY